MNSYFTIEELCKSKTAILHDIDNTPTEEIKEHLKELIAFLNPLRDAWGSPIIITSGYRCVELNKKIGGSVTSAHLLGWAVDCIPQNGKIEEFKDFLINYLKENNCDWDQVLIEQSSTSVWIHIGLYNNYKQQRRMIKYMTV